MTQKMESGILTPITYYRKQSSHPSHSESSKFTDDAKTDYATINNISKENVEEGTYRSNQGIPTGGETKEI